MAKFKIIVSDPETGKSQFLELEEGSADGELPDCLDRVVPIGQVVQCEQSFGVRGCRSLSPVDRDSGPGNRDLHRTDTLHNPAADARPKCRGAAR